MPYRSNPKVAFVCPTFRDENNPDSVAYKIRHAGVIALYEQFLKQDYPRDHVELRIIDSSAKPHSFFADLEDPRVTYINIPDRRNPDPSLLKKHPDIKEFLLSDAELSKPRWRQRIKALQEYCSRKIDPITGQSVPSMADPIQSNIMPIGMMRNIGASLNFNTGGKADILISTDDDDWRSPNYTNMTVKALQSADWTKLTSYYLNIFPKADPEKAVWGIMNPRPTGKNSVGDLEFDMNGRAVRYDPAAAPGDVQLEFKTAQELLTSPRWPLSSSDGCVHAVRYGAWRRAADVCGGFMPVSNAEDHLFYAALKMLGNLENPSAKIFSPKIVPCILGEDTLPQGLIRNDKKLGELIFNPVARLTNDFVRFGGANTSKLVMTDCNISLDVVPRHLHNCFDFFAKVLGRDTANQRAPEPDVRYIRPSFRTHALFQATRYG